MKEIKGSSGYFINESLEVRKPKLDAVKDLPGLLTIKVDNDRITKKLSFWYLISFYGIDIQKHKSKLNDIHFVKINPIVTNWPINMLPLYTGDELINAKYKWLPSVPDYAVDKTGEVYSIGSKRPLKSYTDAYGYLMTTLIPSIREKQRNFRVHRLVAEAWVENKDWFNRSIVNHIDTVRDNPKHDNVEWVTYKVNNEHSSDLGKHGLAKRCILINHVSGIEKLFPSVASACRYIDVKPFMGIADLSVVRSKALKGKYEIKLEDSQLPWNFSKVKLKRSHGLKVTVNYKNKLVKVFSTTSEFYKYFGINNGVDGKHGFKTIKAKILEDNPEISHITKDELVIQVREILSGNVTEHRSFLDVKRLISSAGDGVRISVHRDDQVNINGYQVRRKSIRPWKTPLKLAISITPKKVKLFDIRDNSYLEFKSLRSLARHLNVDRSNLSNTYLNKDKLWKEFYLIKSLARYTGDSVMITN